MRQRTTNIKRKGKIIPTTLNIYECGLCGKERHVRTSPVSKCHCMVKYPSKYMYMRYIIRDFFKWLYQQTILLFKEEWK